ncbi:roadblock/LC7 domain-containing protein [Streptomyces sp. NPDC049906]|uniref:roadblock/LC7 domain-containing protein n=1 Tax=Streptomyces sp. NPDC049906 TaxID=3155656 RepID=UPI0034491837
MAAEADILGELRELRARVPQITGALLASADGFVLAQDADGVETEAVAALTAAALGVGSRLTETTGRGPFLELLVRGTHGYAATYAAGRAGVLTLIADARVNVGRLHLEGRRCGARLGALVEAAARANVPAPTVPPARRPAPEASRPPLSPRPVRQPGSPGQWGPPVPRA